MRLNIERKELVSLLSRGATSAARLSPVRIVTHARLIAKAGTLAVASTDLERMVEATAPCAIEKPGSTTVEAEKLVQAVAKMKGDTVSISLDGADLIVKCGRSRVRFATLPVADWPALNGEIEGEHFELTGADLHALLAKPAETGAMASNATILNGVFLHARFDFGTDSVPVLAAAGTNGHVLIAASIEMPEVHTTLPDNGGRGGVTLSIETTRSALRLFTGDTPLRMFVDKGRIVIESETARLVSKLIEGIYPPYERIIPARQETTISLNRSSALASVDLLETFITKDSGNKLECAASEEGFVLASGSTESDGVDVADAEANGDIRPFGMSSRYLKTVLNAFTGELVTLSYEDPSRPILFVSDSEPLVVGVVSTMRVSTERVSVPRFE